MSFLLKRNMFHINNHLNKLINANCLLYSRYSDKTSPKKLKYSDKKYKLLIVGGGTGGSSIASSFAKYLKNDIAVIEPNDIHYYQSLFTLIGGGLKQFQESQRLTADVLPKEVTWIKDKAVKFDPHDNFVITKRGQKIGYDFLVLTLGLQLNYSNIKGLEEALATDPNVVSIYSPKYLQKVLPAVDNITTGTALFTFPTTPVKCAGAGQKILYLSEERISKAGLRGSVDFKYRTGLPFIFPVPHYAEVLDIYAAGRGIEVSKLRDLVEVRGTEKEAVFDVVGEGRQEVQKYNLLHVTPPMSSPKELWDSDFVNEDKFVKVNAKTLQHSSFNNVFALGDCCSAPTSKTAAACASQVGVVSKNLKAVMEGGKPSKEYNGYTSCPLTVSSKKVILAEFGYDGTILETFPFDQRKPRRSMFFMKAHLLPTIYWKLLLKGMWHGPGFIRKMLRLGM